MTAECYRSIQEGVIYEVDQKFIHLDPVRFYPGNTRAGNIGEGRVTVRRFPAEFDRPIWFTLSVFRGPAPATVNVFDDTEFITWEFEDYEPPDYTVIYILPGITSDDYAYIFKDIYGELGIEPGDRIPGRAVVDNLDFLTDPAPEPESAAVVLIYARKRNSW